MKRWVGSVELKVMVLHPVHMPRREPLSSDHQHSSDMSHVSDRQKPAMPCRQRRDAVRALNTFNGIGSLLFYLYG